MDTILLFKILGFVLLILAVWAFRKPHHFLKGRKAQMWVRWIGEEKTLTVIRWVSSPLLVLIACYLLGVGFGYIAISH